MSLGLIAALLLQAAAPAPSRPPASNLDLPAWSRTPTPAEMAAAYPIDAANVNLAGAATLECTVGQAGDLTDCVVAGETAPGAGFGAAALSLAGKFRTPLKSPSGAPMAGRTVKFPLQWVNPATTKPRPFVVLDDTGRSGMVAFNCRVLPDRGVDNCVVVDAQPRGNALFGVAGEAVLRQKAPSAAKVGSRLLVSIQVQPNRAD
jgi:hypothetical protein